MEKETQFTVDAFKAAGGFEKELEDIECQAGNIVIPSTDDFFDMVFSNNKEEGDIFNKLIANYPEILSKPRTASKCYQEAFKCMNQLIGGTFLCAHDWDKAWLNKVCGKYPIEDLIWDLKNLYERCDKVLHYLKCTPNHYYRKSKHNLADFFCSKMRNGKCWSPFLDLLSTECTTLDMYENMLGDKLMDIVNRTFKEVWFSQDNENKKKFCGGVMSLYSWYTPNRESIIRTCPENAVWFHSFASLLELVKLCNEETRFLYPSYTNPFMKNWDTFKAWCSKRGCKV